MIGELWGKKIGYGVMGGVRGERGRYGVRDEIKGKR